MKKLGLDLGNKTLGIAISDEMNFLSRGLETFRFAEKEYESAINYVILLIKQYNIDVVVLGYPKNMDGTIGEQGQISEQFKESLEQKTNVKIVLWDERLTSRMANNMMIEQNLRAKKRKQDIDKMAAVIILQSYLDQK